MASPRDAVMSHRHGFAPLEHRLAACACALLNRQFPHQCKVGINKCYPHGCSSDGSDDLDHDSGAEATKDKMTKTTTTTTSAPAAADAATPTPNGRVVLTADAFAHPSWLHDPDLRFVSFIGFLRDESRDRTNVVGPERWRTDERMCAELLTMSPSVYTYISLPTHRRLDDDWFNLVLFKDAGFLDAFEKSVFHRYAVEALSARSFTDVCVRSGVWRGGVGPAGTAEVHKSVMLSYCSNENEAEKQEAAAGGQAGQAGSSANAAGPSSGGVYVVRGGYRVQRSVYRRRVDAAAKL